MGREGPRRADRFVHGNALLVGMVAHGDVVRVVVEVDVGDRRPYWSLVSDRVTPFFNCGMSSPTIHMPPCFHNGQRRGERAAPAAGG